MVEDLDSQTGRRAAGVLDSVDIEGELQAFVKHKSPRQLGEREIVNIILRVVSDLGIYFSF